jgi:hypothetical protein
VSQDGHEDQEPERRVALRGAQREAIDQRVEGEADEGGQPQRVDVAAGGLVGVVVAGVLPESGWPSSLSEGPGSAQMWTSTKRSSRKRKRKPATAQGMTSGPPRWTASGSMWKKAAPSMTPAEKESSASLRVRLPNSGSTPPASEPVRMAPE